MCCVNLSNHSIPSSDSWLSALLIASKHKKTLFYCESGQTVEQVAQKSNRISVCGHIQRLYTVLGNLLQPTLLKQTLE